MKDHTEILKWATDCLIAKGLYIHRPPEIVLETPWSTVIRFSTVKEDFYLKQTPSLIFLEPKIIQLMENQVDANVPSVIDINNDICCFLMKDEGLTLRQYLKTKFQPDLLYETIKFYTTIQRATEQHIESFLTLGVPDWRLNKLPQLYNQIIDQTNFLKTEGLADKELKILRDLSPKVAELCGLLLSRYHIPDTIVQPDFNTNNILFNPALKKMTLIDLGEITITHPFFSLHNFLLQAIIHHGVKETDQIYYQLQNTCFESWLKLTTKNQLLEAFILTKKLWPIYSVLAEYRLIMSVDSRAFKTFYAKRPNQIAEYFRECVTQIH